MEKNLSMGPEIENSQPEFKKIQDYIYKFSDQIGMGNFSKVFKGYHQHTNKPVAIKIIQLNSLTNTRLQQLLNTQTKILKILSHPNVIGCEQILSSVRNCYIIMQLCNGGDLEKKLKKSGQFKEKQLYPIIVDIYEGLKYLAKKHIVHRDIKVSNIFISNGIHKIADFGFAQISQVEFRDISVGSPIYMSPQGYINNLYGPKTDVWAFGVLLFELVEGKTPCHDCRSESQLKKNLMKQIDNSNFTSQISNELKNLIIQCLDINPVTRISVLDIQNTQWMKKAYKIVNQNTKRGQKQNNTNTQKRNYKKSFDFELDSKEFSSTMPLTRQSNPSLLLNAKESKQACFKSYLQKFSNFINTEDKEHSQHRRKHSTLDKAQQKTNIEEDSIETKGNNDSIKIFYSPKNAFSKLDRGFGNKNGSPTSKFESFHLKNNIKSPQTSNLKLKDKNLTAGNYAQTCKQQTNFNKFKNWLDKPSSKQGKDINISQKAQKLNINNSVKDKSSTYNLHIDTKQNKDEFKQYKRSQRCTLSGDFRTMIVSTNFTNNNTPITQKFQKHTPKASQSQNSGRFSEFIQARVFKPTNVNRVHHKEQPHEKHEKHQIHKDSKMSSSNSKEKIINRPLKFADCIGLIHYCRLCYKFACLLDQYGEAEQAKKILTSWSIQLLQELNTKITQGDITFNNEMSLMNNPSIIPTGQHERKKKLRDVTDQYLNKYNKLIQPSEKISISLKQASSFIYNLYLMKGHEFKQKVKQKKSHLYLALICYVSLLDRQTRNLMEYAYEIKNSLEGKHIQKLLSIKISEFSIKHIEQIVSQNAQNQF